jgi:hypothetical protein
MLFELFPCSALTYWLELAKDYAMDLFGISPHLDWGPVSPLEDMQQQKLWDDLPWEGDTGRQARWAAYNNWVRQGAQAEATASRRPLDRHRPSIVAPSPYRRHIVAISSPHRRRIAASSPHRCRRRQARELGHKYGAAASTTRWRSFRKATTANATASTWSSRPIERDQARTQYGTLHQVQEHQTDNSRAHPPAHTPKHAICLPKISFA